MTFCRALVASIIFLTTSTVLQLRLLSRLNLIPEYSSSFEPAVIFNPAEKNRSWARQHFCEVGIDLANTTVLLLPTDGELRELVGRDPVIVGSGMSTFLSQCSIVALFYSMNSSIRTARCLGRGEQRAMKGKVTRIWIWFTGKFHGE